MKRITTYLLVLSLLLSFGCAFALTPGDRLVVVGADLTQTQIESVYETFGLHRGEAPELTITSSEERQYLEGLVDESVIGTKSISCICIEVLEPGSGLELRTNNITWCTKEMFLTALSTAGVTDARVIVSAPWASAGTAALAGIYKAWESLSGETLDDTAKDAGAQELSVAASLSGKIGSADALRIIAELKKLVGSEPALDGDALTEKIGELASDLNIRLPEGGSEELQNLFGALKKLDPRELREKAERAAETLQKLQAAKEKASSFADAVRRFFRTIADFFRTLFGKQKDLQKAVDKPIFL